ncbi:N4-gp56 family major capsid protein [Limosilactobacillus fermentum]|uniref:N4-gp56 family major capsid protein n=1 Tax=Limosilactobacillus fermentum TaxID=1613 RepID=A0A1L7GTB9_LIMFE|nr:N4-gp56 family major capsid protein [Limosilactobacillus fermentum]APU45287.1 N4-gp56 family major capsid protein [Limosilactobacillus fermentum]
MSDLTTQLAQMIDPEVMAQMLQAQLPQAVRFSAIAPIDTTLQGQAGDTVTVPRYKYIGDAEDVVEGGAISYNQLTTATQKITIKKAGIGVKLTDEAVLSGYGDPVGEATRQIGMSIASKVDNDILATAKTAKLVVQHAIDLDLIDQVSAQLIDNTSDFNYEVDDTQTGVLFLNKKDADALRKLAANNWTRDTELGDNILVNGSFGELFGWQIVRTRKLAVGYGLAVLPGAMKTYLKRDVNLETQRDIDHKLTKVNADKIYGVAITNDAKIVQIKPVSGSASQ